MNTQSFYNNWVVYNEENNKKLCYFDNYISAEAFWGKIVSNNLMLDKNGFNTCHIKSAI